MTLKKPVKARKVSISLVGEQLVTSTQERTSVGLGGYSKSKSTTTQRISVYEFEQPLDGEKEYSEGQQSYFFEMKIPVDILSVRPQAGMGTSPIKWYLLAKLDVPGGIDITKKVGITIG